MPLSKDGTNVESQAKTTVVAAKPTPAVDPDGTRPFERAGLQEPRNDVDLATVPGFHVKSEGNFIGTYPTEHDAQAFIDGHLTPQNKKAEIVEGAAA